ncbi:RNA dependent RNA polymerase-domain-containing protein [Mycena rosella]|uniref:RNA-dependent RNA polymerase n=1 Tax=Mycena rosella TaxID=1033263 RepID=A0AAD7DQZ1_MYCRO|nr:RNA dependent RNA polymerase-domain-containing protein [Mycena rosella]
MHNKPTLSKQRVPFARLLLDLSKAEAEIVSLSEYNVHESRATRLVGDSRRFMNVSFTKTPRTNTSGNGSTTSPSRAKLSLTPAELSAYTFLGFTESNLKAGHVLFFREGTDYTVEGLKEHFGSLKPVYDSFGYGKYAARLGLSFSSTTATHEIELEDRMLLEDLTADDGSLTSDGCGLIRASYAAEVAAVLGVPFDTSVFQMRLGGIKGTLTRCPDELFDAKCGCLGKKIAYRRSMVKYNDGPHVLEIQSVSKPPKCARLNQQFIVLLLTLGIPLSVFEDLLQMQLDEIDKITTHREKALECVDGDVDAEGDGFHQELYEMLLAGHDMSEPYLAALLQRFQNTSRDALRKKLNIPVKGSGYLLGVVDHCGVLKEGEVYVNLPARGGPQVGPLAAMRNPAYDPDGTFSPLYLQLANALVVGVRVLEAVNKPELKHLTNCIVFAASGARSEPDRMGGGDLDGDTYFVVFNPCSSRASAHTPLPPRVPITATRSAPTISIAGRAQTVGVRPTTRRNKDDMRKDAVDTFVGMRCNFLLGKLANDWMKAVGKSPALADSDMCQALVPMIEAALDVVKAGGIARLRNDYDRWQNGRPEMQVVPGWKNPLEALAERVPQSVSTPTAGAFPEWDASVKEAVNLMRTYNTSLWRAIDADKETKFLGLQEDEKRADLAKTAFIAKHFPPVDNILADVRQYLLKASVWYFTGYMHGKQSFAWLGARWLNYIKAMRSGSVPIAVGASQHPTESESHHRGTSPAYVRLERPPLAGPSAYPLTAHDSSPDSDFLEGDEDSDVAGDTSDPNSDNDFELIDRESAYDTAVEELVPVAARLRISTTTLEPRRSVRQNSDDTLVELEPARAVSTTPTPTSRPRARAQAPPSPVSPSTDATARPRTRAQTRATAPQPEPQPEPARANTNVTTTRPRTRGQARQAEAAPTSRTRSGPRHTHEFLIQARGPIPARVCACGLVWKA